MQHAMADANSVLDLLELRLRKLRASAGGYVLMTRCMGELAQRRQGRAQYREAEELNRECLEICLDLSFPHGALWLCVFCRFLMKGTGAVIHQGCLQHKGLEGAAAWIFLFPCFKDFKGPVGSGPGVTAY